MPKLIVTKRTIEVENKLSEILYVMERYRPRFICHGITDHLVREKDVSWDLFYTDDEQLKHEIYRIIGDKYIRRREEHYSERTTLHAWVVNLPSHLREIQYDGNERAEFRIKFLQWMINKFGDQTIKSIIYQR